MGRKSKDTISKAFYFMRYFFLKRTPNLRQLFFNIIIIISKVNSLATISRYIKI